MHHNEIVTINCAAILEWVHAIVSFAFVRNILYHKGHRHVVQIMQI